MSEKKITRGDIATGITMTDAGAEGKAVGRIGEKVVFVRYAVPGDIADILITSDKKSFFEGKAVKFIEYSPRRTEPRCKHFGLCGGCTWQNMNYEDQLIFKQKQVEDHLCRIGKLDLPPITPILGVANEFEYRNKMEYTFSNRRWLTETEMKLERNDQLMNALGFHMPGMFDRVIDITECFLQDSKASMIRNEIRKYAFDQRLSFYDQKKHTGLLRNLIIRNTAAGQWMVIVVFSEDNEKQISGLMEHLKKRFPWITSLLLVINQKRNTIIADLETRVFHGQPYINEKLGDLVFRIGPVSFFQTNSLQVLRLYETVKEFAGLTGREVVYDLYTGTGSIANFIARNALKVIGIDNVEPAIRDAEVNSNLNEIRNTVFVAGDMTALFRDEFISASGVPDVIITDPPRAGMHPDVTVQLLKIRPERIVYVSCNPATQARDVAVLGDLYSVKRVQPVDMFPHTQHVENVILLQRKEPETDPGTLQI